MIWKKGEHCPQCGANPKRRWEKGDKVECVLCKKEFKKE